MIDAIRDWWNGDVYHVTLISHGDYRSDALEMARDYRGIDDGLTVRVESSPVFHGLKPDGTVDDIDLSNGTMFVIMERMSRIGKRNCDIYRLTKDDDEG